jgi:hypothetical protein
MGVGYPADERLLEIRIRAWAVPCPHARLGQDKSVIQTILTESSGTRRISRTLRG